MDNTQFAYLFGAFLLGFLIAFIAGRSGPKRDLKDCQANGEALQRTIDDRNKAVAKSEAQVAKLQADLAGLGAEKASGDAALAAATAQLAMASATAESARALLQDSQGEILRLRAELRHTGDAWAGARTRSVELIRQLDTVAVMAAEAEVAAGAAEEAMAEAEAGELTSMAQINTLTAKLDVMNRELDLTRAAAARTAAIATMRPQLTPERRDEYAALAGNSALVVNALHERDIAVADAVNENAYLRRSLGIMTAMGSDLAAALEKRNREYDSVSARLTAAALVPTLIATRMEDSAPADLIDVSETADAATDEATPAAGDEVAAELQTQFEDLWTRFNAATAANGDLESQLQAEQANLDALLARLAEINGELESLQSDEDAAPAAAEDVAPVADDTAEAAVVVESAIDADAAGLPSAPEALEAPEAPVEPEAPAEGVLKRLAAGVALAMTAIRRKNERVGGLAAERTSLENGLAEKEQNLADLNSQLDALSTDLNERSVKLDALLLRSSSLETQMELAQGDRVQLEEQVRKIAAELAALADQYAPVAAATPAAPAAEAVAAPVAEAAADAPQDTAVAAADVATDTAAAEAAATEVAAAAMVAESGATDAKNGEVAADTGDEAAETVADAPVALPTALALLAASVARIQDVVAAQQRSLADSGDRLTTLGGQLDAVNEEESALTATLADKDAALADAGLQLDTLHASLAAALAEHEGIQQRISGYHAQLSDLLAQYAEPEAPVAEETLPGDVTAAPVAAAVAPDAAADLEAAPEGESEAEIDVEPEAEQVPEVDAVAATIAAISALFVRKQSAITALSGTASQLDADLANKDSALSDALSSYANLEGEVSKRSVQYDALSMRSSSLEADMELARMERARFESQLQAVADKLGAIAASYAEAPAADEAAAPISADVTAPVEEIAAPAPKPLVAQLEGNAAAVIAVVESKAAALSAAQAQIDALQQDLTTRSSDLDATSAQASDLAAQLADAETAKADLENSLSEIGQKVAALRVEVDAEPVDDAPAEADVPDGPVVADASGAAPVDGQQPTEAPTDDEEGVGPTAILAGIAGLSVAFARRRKAIDAGKGRIAELEQEVADLTTQLQAAELDRDQINQNLEASGAQIEALTQQVADLQAQLDAATAERDGLRGTIDEISANLEALGAAADADNDEEEDRAVDSLVKAGLVAGGATALVSSRRNKRNALKDADVQVEQLQQQLTAATAAQADLEARIAAQLADFEAANGQIQALQAELEAAAAEKVSVQETMQRQLEETQTQLQAQDSQLVGMRRQLDLEAEWQRKSPFLADLIQKLNKWSGAKSVAASAALEEQVVPKTVKLPENLTYVTHIGKTYADRLHDAEVGTYWELAFTPDEELAQILKLNELQLMGMNFEEVRTSARQLAIKNGSVGHMWERVAYDDFEKVKGIGSKLERRLYDAGITTYAQIAAMTPEQLNDICQPKPPLRPKYDRWIAQAQELVAAQEQAEAAAAASAEPAAEAAPSAEQPAVDAASPAEAG